MKTKYLFLAALSAVALFSCTSEDYVGLTEDSPATEADGAIKFGFDMQKTTRGDIAGKSAADLLGSNFYVTGTKGTGTSPATEPATSPTTTLVFDNYLVHYGVNTAGTTESNTANWEYVGVNPPTSPYDKYVKLSNASAQTIKYWDYSTDQYDFLAFSTGTYKAVSGAYSNDNEIGVTAMKYGADLANKGVAYTFKIPTVAALKNTYITDITTVKKANYGKEVTLKFKNLGSKVRIALYETVPGYSVQAASVKFYQVDGTTDFTGTKTTTATMISADNNGLPTNATIQVYFPHVGADNAGYQDYNMAAGTVAPLGSYEKYKGFGTLNDNTAHDNLVGAEDHETSGYSYLGRSLPAATFAGEKAADYYETLFPVSSSAALTLRIDYTLVSTDGSGETINVYGAKAVVPSTYTKWLPNYAYTYIFKISDNTNGWTTSTGTVDENNQGLYPITFDAVVAEATDVDFEQTTITTVSAPTITTYQQNHKYTTNEYAKATGKNIYVQVMNNSANPATLMEDLNDNTPEGTAKSLLYAIDASHAAKATEAMVMDALEKRTATYSGSAASITGRNELVLTKKSITNKVNSIVNGVDDNPIDVTISGDTKSKAAMITITGDGALEAGTYAYVYDYTSTSRTEIVEYQPITPGSSYIESDASTKTFYTVTTTQLGGISAETADVDLTAAGANDYLYFSKTTNGSGTTTYSYISIVGKTSLPAGVVKIAKTSVGTAQGNASPASGTFYFDKYFSNNGKYAVKVIKVI